MGGLIGSSKIVPVGSEIGLVSTSSSESGFSATFGRYLSLRASKSTGSSKSGACLLRLLSGSKLLLSKGGEGDLLRLSAKFGFLSSKSASESSVLPDCGIIFLTGSVLATFALGGLHFTLSARYFSYFGLGFGFGSATRTHCPLHSFHCLFSSYLLPQVPYSLSPGSGCSGTRVLDI